MITSITLLSHIVLGAIAVLSGTMALFFRKGGRVHVQSGKVFALSMILSSILGAVLGIVKLDELYITFHAGVLSVTLIADSLITLRRQDSLMTGAGRVIAGANLLNLLGLLAIGSYAIGQTNGEFLGFHAANYFFLGGMAILAGAGDFSLISRKTFSYKHRIARHLWRMCLGFFIAAGSAFTGPGAVAFPEMVRESGVLSLPELVILLSMLFWLAKTLLKRQSPAVK